MYICFPNLQSFGAKTSIRYENTAFDASPEDDDESRMCQSADNTLSDITEVGSISAETTKDSAYQTISSSKISSHSRYSAKNEQRFRKYNIQ